MTIQSFSPIEANARAAELAREGRSMLIVAPPGFRALRFSLVALEALPAPSILEESWIAAQHESAFGVEPRQTARPLRAPHYTISRDAMLGKMEVAHLPKCGHYSVHASCACPRDAQMRRLGELDRARFGVLALNELTEFTRDTINAMSARLRRWPAGAGRPIVVATAQPCGCGWHGNPIRGCLCPTQIIERQASRLDEFRKLLDIADDAIIPLTSV